MHQDLSLYKDFLDDKLKNGKITPKILFNNCAFLNENSKLAPAFYDNTWSTIYHHLGDIYKSQSICEVNFSLGLFPYAFLRKKSDLQSFVGFYPKNEKDNLTIPKRLGIANIKKKAKNCKFYLHVGNLYDDAFYGELNKNRFDLLIFSELNSYNKTLEMLDFFYPFVLETGLIILEEYKNKEVKEAMDAFCSSKNKVPYVFKTRYGTAILQK